MVTSVCLVTGQPGVGKTTLCRTLVEAYPERFETVSFGRLIREEVTRTRGVETSELALREHATEYVSPEVITNASYGLYRTVEFATREWLLLDSHAASQDQYGFRSTPDGETYFNRLSYSAIVQLFLPEARLLERISRNRDGRYGATEDDLQRLFTLQVAVSTGYAARCECPLYLVDSSKVPSDLAVIVNRLLGPG